MSRRNRRGSPRCARRDLGRRRVYDRAGEDQRPDHGEHQNRPDHDPVDPALVGHERQAQEQERDEREDVEGAVEHDGGEATSPRVGAPRHPPGAQQVADATGEHVVDRHARDDHLDEAALAEPGVGDPPPAGRLHPVDDAHARHRAEQRQRPDAGERAPHASEVGSPDREHEKDDRDRDADRSRDDERAAAAVPRDLRHARGRSRGRDGRVGNDGHAPSIVIRLGTGHPQGSRATLALGPDRHADPRAKILS